MKILLLTPWFPWPPFDGASIRIFETIRYLSRRHSVTLLANVQHLDDVKKATPLLELCDRVEATVLSYRAKDVLARLAKGTCGGFSLVQSAYYDAALAEHLHVMTSQESYDLIQLELYYATRYIQAIRPSCPAKKVLSMHNVETIRYAREIKLPLRPDRKLAMHWDRLLFKDWEARALQQFDGVITVSELEQRWVQRHIPETPVAMVPNGVDTRYFDGEEGPVRKPDQAPSLVFIGAMHYPPNVDAVIWFCQAVFPQLRQRLPELCFKIVGRQPHPKVVKLGQQAGVVVTGEVDDVRPYMAEASAFVVPLRSGGGTRLKILEAMAMGRPVVSTTVGAEGIEATSGVDILLADQADSFARQIWALLSYPEAADRIAQAGRKLVTETYDWRICLGELERWYDKVGGSEVR